MSRVSRVTPSQTVLLCNMSTIPRVTPHPTSCIWDHTSTVCRESPLPRPCTLGHMSIVLRVTPPPRPSNQKHLHIICMVTPPPRPYTWNFTSIVSMMNPSQTMHLGSHTHSFQGDLLSPCTGGYMTTVSTFIPHIRSFTWCHMATASLVNPFIDPIHRGTCP